MRILLLLLLMLNLLNAKKIALLIGNSDYAKKTLSNPTNDIDLLAEKLSHEKIGFTVYKRPNLTKSQMIDELREFYGKVDSNTIALIYFSGHGVHSTIDDKNYLIPIGGFSSLLNEAQLSDVAVSDSYLLGSTNGAKFSILLLDACRSNDFAKTKGDKGLGLPQSGLANDYVISYATKEGKTAEDGYNNSPYALALSHHLLGNHPIEDLFRKVRREVMRETSGKQEPLYSPSFNEKLCLTGNCGLIDNSQELARLKAENERLKQQQNVYVPPKVVVEEPLKVVHTTDGITQIGNQMYQNQPFTKKYTWKKAGAYCQGLTLGGHRDWRLPTRDELFAIGNIKKLHEWKDYDTWKKWFDKNKHRRFKNSKGESHFIDKRFIENMPKYSYFWTSEEKDSSHAWFVRFVDGRDDWGNKTSSIYALCVR